MENICRTCLRHPDVLVSLFDETQLSHKIETISCIRITNTDNLPSGVCEECVENINLSYNFRRLIIDSDLELQCILEKRSEDNIQIEVKTECDQHHMEYIKEETVTDAEIEMETLSNETNKGKNKQRTYRCQHCEFVTWDYCKYKSHRQGHLVRKAVCSICGKTIRSDNLKKHIATHTDPPAACKECGKVCKNTESLRSHMLIHKGQEVTCEYCGQIYKYRGGYQRHVQKNHIGLTKTVQCHLCDKSFFDSTVLKKHIRSHTGERPYPCQYCNKGFSSSYALKTHVRQHTNERPYKCELCPMAFPQKVSLRTHMKSKHCNLVDNTSNAPGVT